MKPTARSTHLTVSHGATAHGGVCSNTHKFMGKVHDDNKSSLSCYEEVISLKDKDYCFYCLNRIGMKQIRTLESELRVFSNSAHIAT